jgi:broad specificity phosphatase PhoE
LTDFGKEQAKQSGINFFKECLTIIEELKNYKIEFVSSDFLRARQTAELFIKRYIIYGYFF